MNKAVFLDRDGVVTREPPHYAHKPEQLVLIPGAGDAIRLLNENGFVVIIVSNQAGIARGYYQKEDMISFNRAMDQKLAEVDAHIDAYYYCLHHLEAKVGEYRIDCDCRKPKPGMLLKAEKEQGIDMRQSFMIGDKLTDIEAGKRAGCRTILVKTGYGSETVQNEDVDCELVAEDLYRAVSYILY